MRRSVVIGVLSILAAALVVGAGATVALLVGRESTGVQAASTVARPGLAPTDAAPSAPKHESTTSVAPPPTTTPAARDAHAGRDRCETSMLSATLTDTQGAAGTVYSHVVFTNISSQSCTLSGYPGVSFVDDRGGQIGAPAPRVSGHGGVVTLGPASSAWAVFALHNAYVGTVDGCQPTLASGLRVYPPGEASALFVPAPSRVCANPATDGSASITAVTSGATVAG